jgi:hypothetical protein
MEDVRSNWTTRKAIMRTTSISVAASRDYVAAISVLAKRHGLKMGDLVRQSLDEKYGDEIKNIQAVFFADGGTDIVHLDDNSDTPAKAAV